MTMPDVAPLLDSMASDIKTSIMAGNRNEPAMVGIHSGGAWLAKELHRRLGLKQPLGLMDISFYRDDFHGKGLHPQVQPSNLPFSVEGQHVILVDDVIMSGRTIRACLNELSDYCRPA